MKRFSWRGWLLKPPSIEDFVRVLRAWRLWLLGALLGGAIGAACYYVFPPQYHASATVIVDHNLEQAWPEETDRKLFYYLERESRKLEDLAWSDATLEKVTQQVEGKSLSELRQELLALTQTHDGAWHFWAKAKDPELASALASGWAQSFVQTTREGIETALLLASTRQKYLTAQAHISEIQQMCSQIEAGISSLESLKPLLAKPETLSVLEVWRVREFAAWLNWSSTALYDVDQPGFYQTLEQIARERLLLCQETLATEQAALEETKTSVEGLEEQSVGLSPYLEVSPSIVEDLPVERLTTLAVYVFIGSVCTTLLVVLAVLIGSPSEEKDAS
ncbi:MAG: hypothetical protein AB1345_13510 [Chloroflexota bacterium]